MDSPLTTTEEDEEARAVALEFMFARTPEFLGRLWLNAFVVLLWASAALFFLQITLMSAPFLIIRNLFVPERDRVYVIGAKWLARRWRNVEELWAR